MDDSEFGRIYGEHRNAVYRYARLLTGSTEAAEDIVQECFLAVAKGRFRSEKGVLRAYLLGAARRQAFKRFRKLEREVELDDSAAAPLAEPYDMAAAVADAVAALPALQREAVLLFSWEGFKLEEIAEMTGVDTGTIKSRLSRGREALRRRLAPFRPYIGGSNGTVAR